MTRLIFPLLFVVTGLLSYFGILPPSALFSSWCVFWACHFLCGDYRRRRRIARGQPNVFDLAVATDLRDLKLLTQRFGEFNDAAIVNVPPESIDFSWLWRANVIGRCAFAGLLLGIIGLIAWPLRLQTGWYFCIASALVLLVPFGISLAIAASMVRVHRDSPS
jgi:hypothetical protein